MTAEPPFEAGADHDTTAEESPNTPATPEGTPGTVAGTTAPDATDAEPVPTRFVAVTVNVYDVPLVSPGTVHEVVADVHVNEPGDEITV